jgi:hypothetical protein
MGVTGLAERIFEKYVNLIDRPPAPRERGTLKKNLALKSPVNGGFRGRFRDVSDFSGILLKHYQHSTRSNRAAEQPFGGN